MRHILLTILAVLPLLCMAQTYTTPYGKAERKAARQWVKKGEWRNGFTKASPDKNVNAVDFQRQYARNTAQWQALFQWLQSTDLLALTAGSHPIPGTTMSASVQDDTNKPMEKVGSESHRRKIDFQWVVSGTEGFAVIDHDSSKPNCEYSEKKDVIHYDYVHDKARTFTNRKGRFNIFFPGDWHIAKIQTGKATGDGKFRVIVVKVDYKE